MKTRTLFFSMTMASCAATALAQQVPNGNFENWYTPAGASYQDPVDWVTKNNFMTQGWSGYVCTQGSPGVDGSDHYMTVTTQSDLLSGANVNQVVAGNSNTQKPGFPFSDRPFYLTGQMECGGYGDSCVIQVQLTKWYEADHYRQVVGMGKVERELVVPATSWSPFQLEISYLNAETPDSAFIQVTADLVFWTGDHVSVDNLEFVYGPMSVSEHGSGTVQVFPSPATDLLHVGTDRAMARVTLLDITGRTVLVQPETGNMAQMDVADLRQGRYLVQVDMQDGKRMVRSFVKE